MKKVGLLEKLCVALQETITRLTLIKIQAIPKELFLEILEDFMEFFATYCASKIQERQGKSFNLLDHETIKPYVISFRDKMRLIMKEIKEDNLDTNIVQNFLQKMLKVDEWVGKLISKDESKRRLTLTIKTLTILMLVVAFFYVVMTSLEIQAVNYFTV